MRGCCVSSSMIRRSTGRLRRLRRTSRGAGEAPGGIARQTTSLRPAFRAAFLWALLWLVCGTAVACGGGDKKEKTTPDKAASSGGTQAMPDPGDPSGLAGGASTPMAGTSPGAGGPSAGGASAAPAGSPGAGGGGATPGSPDLLAGPVVTMPNYDPDPAQARTQVEQHLKLARVALASPTPDAEAALHEARQALEIDAANVDAAAMVAFAYYHKKLYDTAELVLDDLFKRDAAKQNANVYYVYGLIYDHTNRSEQAVLSFKKAVELNPNHASALVNLGVHQLQNSQYDDARASFERLVNQFGRSDAITMTSLGSAYRGHAADYPTGSPDHDDNVRKAEAAYKRALQANSSYGPAYYNLGLLYLDNDPFPGLSDTLLRLNTAKGYFDQYKNMPNLEMKLYDDRMKDVTKAIKRAEKLLKKSKGGSAGGAAGGSTPAPGTPGTPAAPKAKTKGGAKRGNP
jgi:tetratricopeptide (TPR) repeat protein